MIAKGRAAENKRRMIQRVDDEFLNQVAGGVVSVTDKFCSDGHTRHSVYVFSDPHGNNDLNADLKVLMSEQQKGFDVRGLLREEISTSNFFLEQATGKAREYYQQQNDYLNQVLKEFNKNCK